MIRIKNQNYTPVDIRLPVQYQEVEYIESTGTQYINTGFMPNQNTKVETTFAPTKRKDSFLYGARKTSSTAKFSFAPFSGDGIYLVDYGTLRYSGQSLNLSKYTITQDKNKFYLNNTLVNTASSQTFSPNLSMGIFANNTGGTFGGFAYAKIYDFKIWNNNVLVRDFVPCYRKSDNVTGFYDLVNNQFYTNAGTGTFLRGGELPKNYVKLKPKIGNKNVLSRYVGNDLVYGADLKQKVNYTMLYDYGDECEELTGGWRYYPIAESNNNKHHNFTNHTFTKNDDNLYLYGKGQSTSYNDKGAALTTNSIDTSGYNSAFVKANYGTFGRNCVVSAMSFTSNNLDVSGVNTEILSKMFSSDPNSITPNVNNKPSIFSYISGNDTFGIVIISGGYAASLGVYLKAFTIGKPDSWETLASIAGISASSVYDILTNSTTLLNNENAVKFMISYCTGEFMLSAVTNQTFLTALNNSPYKTIIQGNPHWNKFLSMVA